MGNYSDGILKSTRLIDCGKRLVVVWEDRKGREQLTILELPIQLEEAS